MSGFSIHGHCPEHNKARQYVASRGGGSFTSGENPDGTWDYYRYTGQYQDGAQLCKFIGTFQDEAAFLASERRV